MATSPDEQQQAGMNEATLKLVCVKVRAAAVPRSARAARQRGRRAADAPSRKLSASRREDEPYRYGDNRDELTKRLLLRLVGTLDVGSVTGRQRGTNDRGSYPRDRRGAGAAAARVGRYDDGARSGRLRWTSKSNFGRAAFARVVRIGIAPPASATVVGRPDRSAATVTRTGTAIEDCGRTVAIVPCAAAAIP